MSTQFTRWQVFALAGALLVSSAATAEPIRVEYLVDQRAFAIGTTATSPLNFELFSDAQCTVSLGSVQQLAGNTSLQYFLDRTRRVRGGLYIRPPVRILAVIDGATANTAPYLKVTGPGMTPVGGACQLQPGGAVAAGASGPTGPMGPAGPEGPEGPAGATGPAGANGVDGATGPAGANGLDGATGPAGANGVDGATGPVGPEGPEGPAGATGPAGANGLDGATGPAGPAGATGPAGANGLDGATGPAGANGLDGATGPAGPAGPAGATGPAGQDGADGTASLVVEAEQTVFDNGSGTAPTVVLGDNSPERICFLTFINAKGADLSPNRQGMCSVDFDPATGWSLTADGGTQLNKVEVTCAARCLSW